MPVSADQIYHHNKIPQHTNQLIKALEYKPNIRPHQRTSNGAHLAHNGSFTANPPFGAHHLGANLPFGTNLPLGTNIPLGTNLPLLTNVPRPNVGTNMPHIGAYLPMPNMATNIPPIGPNYFQVPMASNLPQNFLNHPKDSAKYSPPLVSNWSGTNEHIENNENKINDIQFDENESNDMETNKTSSNEEDEESEYISDKDLIEFNTTLDTSSDDVPFDFEEYVYLKLKNTYVKVSNTAYNSLVHVGDGTRYCFVCAIQIEHVELQKHVDSRPHLENMEKYRFLAEYESHLFRQVRIFLIKFSTIHTHCSIMKLWYSSGERTDRSPALPTFVNV